MKEKEIDYEVAQDNLQDKTGGGGSSHSASQHSSASDKSVWITIAAVVLIGAAVALALLL